MREKALGDFIVFSVFLIVTQFSTAWMKHKIYFMTNKSPTDMLIHRKEVRFNPKKQYDWLIENSTEPSQTRRWLITYQLCQLPAVFGLLVSVIGLYTSKVDVILDNSAPVILLFNMLLVFSGMFQGRRR